MKKNVLSIIILVLNLSFLSCAQSQENNNNSITTLKKPSKTYSTELLKAPDTWGKEIIVFPIEWAPKMNVIGYEDLRFAPNWSNSEHDDFWSLVMAWKIYDFKDISLEYLESNLVAYFDGLMTPNHWSQDFQKPVLTLYDLKRTELASEFKGKLVVFDGFHTGKLITLNIVGQQLMCEDSEKTILVYKFSPQDYSHPIWSSLQEVSLLNTKCN